VRLARWGEEEETGTDWLPARLLVGRWRLARVREEREDPQEDPLAAMGLDVEAKTQRGDG
jgi:hypothetical protein